MMRLIYIAFLIIAETIRLYCVK